MGATLGRHAVDRGGRETDGRWIAAVDPTGALAYGRTRAEAVRKAKAVALEVIADRLAHGESPLTGRKRS
jgi:predicted RNase H-like HicB family nuclease